MTTASGPVVAIALVRLMSREQYGDIAIATALVSLLCVLTGHWLAPALTQVAAAEGATNGDAGRASVLRGSWRVAVVACFIGAASTGLAAALFDMIPRLHGSMPSLLAMLPVVILAPVTGMSVGFLRADFQVRWLSIATALSSLLTGGLIVSALAAGQRTSLTVGLARSIGTVVFALLLVVPVVRWANRHTPNPGTAPPIRRIVTFGLAMMLSGVFATAVSQLDVFVLGAVRGSHAAALYTPASAVADGVMALPALIGTFFLPTITAMASKRDFHAVRVSYHWAARWNLVVCAPALGVLLACPGSIMRVLFGSSFGAMATQLRILGVGAAVQILLAYSSLTLDGFGLARLVAWRQAISLAVSTLSCVVLVPLLGSLGAALATTIAVVLANLFCSGTLALRFHISPWDSRLAVTSAALAAGVAAAWLTDNTVSGDFTRIALAVLLAGVVTGIVALVVSDPAERRSIRDHLLRLSSRLGSRI
ncbi:MAG: lipopolysaccharide biosynthesis protein [Acidimicrobiales bacterium]